MKRLSLKKSAIIAGLTLTLMLSAFVGVSMDSAHAAPAMKKSRISSQAMVGLKKASKHTSQCKSGSQFWVNPCGEHETDTGSVSGAMVAHGLIPNTAYIIWAPELDTQCGNSTLTSDAQNLGTGAVETSDFSGNLNVAFTATGCIASSKADPVVLETDGYNYKTWTSSFEVEKP